jgi:hypothetical protein
MFVRSAPGVGGVLQWSISAANNFGALYPAVTSGPGASYVSSYMPPAVLKVTPSVTTLNTRGGVSARSITCMLQLGTSVFTYRSSCFDGQDTVVLTGTNFGPSTEADNLLHVSFTHAAPDALSLTFVGIRCAVTTSHVNITCTTPAGIGASLVWTAFVDGQASYKPGTTDTLPVGVTVADIATMYTRPWVRQVWYIVAASLHSIHAVGNGCGLHVQVKSVEGAGADSAATNGGQVFYVHGDFFGTSNHTPQRLVVTYGPNMTDKYTAGQL